MKTRRCVRALRSDSGDLRASAILTLGEIGTPDCVSALSDWLRSSPSPLEDKEIRALLHVFSCKPGNPAVVNALLQALRTGTADCEAILIRGLGDIGRGVDVLDEILGRSDRNSDAVTSALNSFAQDRDNERLLEKN